MFTYGSKPKLNGARRDTPTAAPDGSTSNQALGLFAVWGSTVQYKQQAKKSLPAGTYQLSYTYWNSSENDNTINACYIGFVEDGGTTHYGGTAFKHGVWTTETITFTLSAETSGYFSIGYHGEGTSSANAMLYIDNIKLVNTATLVKDNLLAAIQNATTANTHISSSDLTSAIATAQAVYDNTSATQEQVDAAVTTLNNAVTANINSGDVTGIFLKNYDFETAPIAFTNNALNSSAKLIRQNSTGVYIYAVPAWTCASIGNSAIQQSTATYGGDYKSDYAKGLTSTNPPSADNAGNSGSALYIAAGWGNQAILTQASQNVLPAGKYVLTYNVYNPTSATSIADNYTGVIIDGTATYSTKKSATQNTWESETVTFTLSEPKTVVFSVGFKNSTKGTGDAAKLYIDNIKLTYTNPADAYKEALADAKAAKENGDYSNVTGDEKSALDKAITDYSNVTSDYDAATTALNNATAAFIAAKDAYDSYAEEKARAEELGVTVGDAPTSASAATEALKTLNVAEYNAVTNKYTAPIDLGEWTKSGIASTRSGEHWSGNTKTTYINQNDDKNQGYNSSSWNMAVTQDITLPAGTYVFKASGRKSSDAVLTLKVANGETSLASVTNFPVGNSEIGITTSGVASFETASEDVVYANSNKGYGWQWRFAPFTLSEETKVTISVSASANSEKQWASFSDYTVQAIPSVTTATTAYKQAYANAQTALKSDDYKNIGETATERTALAAYPENPTGTTVEAIDNKTAAVKAAIETFTAAKANYDAFATAKATTDPNLKYASETAHTAFTKAIAATPTTSADAKTNAEAITTALRAYYESNAKAEGVNGAEEIYTYDFTGVTVSGKTVGDWTASQTGGELSVNSNESWTDANGKNSYGYFNYYNNSANNQHATHKIALEAGKYILTVKARAQSGLNTHLTAAGKDLDLQEIGNTGGVFGRGWNDATLEFTTPKGDVTLEWYSAPYNGNKAGWAGFGDVRLYKIGELETVELKEDASAAPTATDDYVNVTYNRSFKQYWNSIVLPFDASLTELGASDAIEYAGTSNTTINFTSVTTLEANKPYMVYFDEAKTDATTFSGKTIAPSESLTTTDATGNQYNFVGTYVQAETSPIEAGDYVVVSGGIQKAKGGNTLKAFRAYFDAQSAEATAKSFNFTIDGNVVTGVKAIELQNAVNNGAVYNLAGQRVSDSYKGVVIKNGKKYVK